MERFLRNVLDYFVTTKIALGGVAERRDTPDQQALLSDIPATFERYLIKRGNAHLFKVQGSIGNGNMAHVPWVAIFRKAVTQNAENGYYVVLLFAQDMSCCYLSLNQGVTAVEDLYTRNFAWRKMRKAADEAGKRVDRHPEAAIGPINLGASGKLGRGYEVAAIESFQYLADELPDDETFFQHLDHLMRNYDILVRSVGNDLYSLFSITEQEFQQVVLEKASARPIEITLPSSVDPTAPVVLGSRGLVRSPLVSAQAIRAANFSCEIDSSHRTFTSKARGQKYVEAHHLIPVSQQLHFGHSLDTVANIISLCATCHRLVHFATPQEKNSILRSLLRSRRQRLEENSITVTEKDFLDFYGRSALAEE